MDHPLKPPKQNTVAPTRLPSMQSLKAFDAVAKFGSTVQAAEHLHITPSAITHQLRKLEESFGARLVRRNGRNLELTSAGNRYAAEVRRALQIIAQASIPVGDEEPYGHLCINCQSGFGAHWLSQHIGKFNGLYPNVSIKVVTPDDRIDVFSNDIDLSIVYGDGVWPGMQVELLYSPRFFPVCSPRLIEAFGEVSHPNDLSNYPLLHHKDYSDWAIWLAAVKANGVKSDQGTVFTDVNHCIAAARAGHGIAIGDNVLASQAVRDGALVRLFRGDVVGSKSYYLVTQDEKRKRLAVAAFRKWVFSEFEKSVADG
ncbi:LysR substrate-binding domain-containing protein [Pelagibius sp. Alg239-R121]|uniref:LysR substrate-binding domain-containing protein n=1 Tax=Pelagibius sp. Alg239-R121 TaxID=2993448 RepID=UPI0024A73F2C|nr:LysR substrate-binding domain-containing protein [Pelagibius sp. Alg239-R121]